MVRTWSYEINHLMGDSEAELLAYLAGIIDADGCIGILRTKTGFVPNLSCGQVAEEAVTMLHAAFGGSVSKTKLSAEKNRRGQHRWRVSNQIAGECAHLLLPYLRIKRRQAEAVIEAAGLNHFWVNRGPLDAVSRGYATNRLWELWNAVRLLNHVGTVAPAPFTDLTWWCTDCGIWHPKRQRHCPGRRWSC